MRSKNVALALLAAAQFVVVLDASIVNVALPVDRPRPRLRPGRPVLGGERQVGGALGLAILSTIATNRTQDVFASGVRDPKIAFTEGFQDAFFAGGVIALIGAMLAMVLISTADSRRMAEQADGGASPRRRGLAPAALLDSGFLAARGVLAGADLGRLVEAVLDRPCP